MSDEISPTVWSGPTLAVDFLAHWPGIILLQQMFSKTLSIIGIE